ncbi:MAG: glycosyltransferase [Winogradskyella sp.]|nr:glycosyltransferase [Winogradskyella sp.]
MRVLQLIDSLDAGGAERLSVSLANALVNEIEGSYLCATRNEGNLKSTINSSVTYLFLKRKSRFDLKAILKLRRFIKQHKINIIHAHSSSFFIATVLKMTFLDVNIIWHDHYGKSEFLIKRPKRALRLCSHFFSHIYCVNEHLLNWSKKNLNCDSVSYLQNFVVLDNLEAKTHLYGINGKRIICLANLRPQKDHFTLFKSFEKIIVKHPEWTLHCVGKAFNDNYSKSINDYIILNKLEQNVFLYGTQSDIRYILEQCDIGVLSSKSEGLPIALLEYASAKLAVIVTDVGNCSKVIDNSDKGKIVKSGDHKALYDGLLEYIENDSIRLSVAEKLHTKVVKMYSKEAVVDAIIDRYKSILNLSF